MNIFLQNIPPTQRNPSLCAVSADAPISLLLNIYSLLAIQGNFVTQQSLVLQFPLHSGSAKPQLQQECAPSEAFFPAGLFSCVRVKSVFPLQRRRTYVWAAVCVSRQSSWQVVTCLSARKRELLLSFPCYPSCS